jgi:hypothetical protein
MAHNGKRGFFSSLFGKKKQNEDEGSSELDSRQRLEERIQQILAERVKVPEPLIKENPAALMIREEEAEPEIELLPISASVLSSRKERVPVSFLASTLDIVQSHAANAR